jgi:hypothetical protein
MLMITLVCDDCHTGAIGLVPYQGGDGIRDVWELARLAGWRQDSRTQWHCPTCRIALERSALVPTEGAAP